MRAPIKCSWLVPTLLACIITTHAQELIATTPARTAAGIVEQIWLALEETHDGSGLSDKAQAGLALAFETLHAAGAAVL